MKSDSPSLLIVDDAPVVRLLLSEIAESGGWKPILAPGGKEALVTLKREMPAAAMVDLRMPGMDGFQLFQAILRDYPKLPVVMISAYADTQMVSECMACGAFAFLDKPFVPAKVLKVLRSLKMHVEKQHPCKKRASSP